MSKEIADREMQIQELIDAGVVGVQDESGAVIQKAKRGGSGGGASGGGGYPKISNLAETFASRLEGVGMSTEAKSKMSRIVYFYEQELEGMADVTIPELISKSRAVIARYASETNLRVLAGSRGGRLSMNDVFANIERYEDLLVHEMLEEDTAEHFNKVFAILYKSPSDVPSFFRSLVDIPIRAEMIKFIATGSGMTTREASAMLRDMSGQKGVRKLYSTMLDHISTSKAYGRLLKAMGTRFEGVSASGLKQLTAHYFTDISIVRTILDVLMQFKALSLMVAIVGLLIVSLYSFIRYESVLVSTGGKFSNIEEYKSMLRRQNVPSAFIPLYTLIGYRRIARIEAWKARRNAKQRMINERKKKYGFK